MQSAIWLLAGLSQMITISAVFAQAPGAPNPQPAPGPLPPLVLLSQKSVQEELKLTPQQVSQVSEAARKERESFEALATLSPDERSRRIEQLIRDGEKTVATILKPDQAKRLRQISLQQQGTRAFSDPAVAKELQMTDEQAKRIRDIYDRHGKEFQDLLQNPGVTNAQVEKKAAELRRADEELVLRVLTKEQRAKWQEMQGEPFKGEIRLEQPKARGP